MSDHAQAPEQPSTLFGSSKPAEPLHKSVHAQPAPDWQPSSSVPPDAHQALHSIFIGDDAPQAGSPLSGTHPLEAPPSPTPIIATDKADLPYADRPLAPPHTPIIAVDKPGPRDDAPAMWGTSPQVPAHPAPAISLRVEASLPDSIPSGANPSLRSEWWAAFAREVTTAGTRHAAMRVGLAAYQNAQNDGDLEALRFVNGSKKPVDVFTHTNNQKLPNQGGRRLGDLFSVGKDGKEHLNLGAADRAAIDGAAAAVQRGEGDVERSGRATSDADHVVKSKLNSLAAAGKNLEATQDKLRASLASLERAKANRQAALHQEELEGLEKRIASSQRILQLTKSIVTTIAYSKTDLGDAIGAVFDVAASAIELANSGAIEDIKDKLGEALADAAEYQDMAVVSEHKSALKLVKSAVFTVGAATDELRAVQGKRRDAHDLFAGNAATASGAPQRERQKLESVISSLPLMETAREKAKLLAGVSIPLTMRGSAMRGFGIAKANAHPIAEPFEQATNEIAGVHAMANQDLTRWTQRIREVASVKAQILGHHPAGDDDA